MRREFEEIIARLRELAHDPKASAEAFEVELHDLEAWAFPLIDEFEPVGVPSAIGTPIPAHARTPLFYAEAGGISLSDYEEPTQAPEAQAKKATGWGTDAAVFATVVAEFERALPGFWWSVGQCSVGAHASCAVDGKGCQADLLARVHAGDPLDTGFHCDTDGGSPAEALRNVMDQALAYLAASKGAPDAGGHPKAQKESTR